MKLNEFVYERLKKNKKLFSEKEWNVASENLELMKKIYVIGAKDVCNIKKEDD